MLGLSRTPGRAVSVTGDQQLVDRWPANRPRGAEEGTGVVTEGHTLAPIVPRSPLRYDESIMKRNIALATGSLLLFFLIAEISLRIAGYGNALRYQPDQAVLWRPVPNQNPRSRVSHSAMSINSHGMRGRETTMEKPEGVTRILTVGDSFNFGWEMPDHQTWPARLEKILHDRGAEVEVLNGGVIGYSISQAAAYLEADGPKFSPDLVVLSYCWNEGRHMYADSPPDVKKRVMRAVRIKNFLRRSACYIFFGELKGRRVFYARMKNKLVAPEYDDSRKTREGRIKKYKESLQGAVRFCRENDLPLVLLLTTTWDNVKTEDYTRFQRYFVEVSEEEGVPLIRTLDLFAGSERTEYFLFEGHPNEVYYEKEAERVAEFILAEGLID